jgi:hypothetical protein
MSRPDKHSISNSLNKRSKILSKSLLFLVSCLLVYSCKDSETTGDQFTHEIKFDKIDPITISFEELISDYKYIKLETTSESILDEPRQILIHSSRIIIVTKVIHCFDMQGNFLYTINSLGRGPGEFIQILNVSINEKDLFITSTKGQILVFDLITGKFKHDFNLGFSVAHCEVSKDYLYMDRKFFTNGSLENKGRIIISSISKPQSEESFFEGEKYSVFVDKQFVGYNSAAYFIDPFYNEVFKLKDGSISNFAKFDFGDASPTDSEIQRNIEERITSKSVIRHVSNISDVYETDDFIIANFIYKNKYSVLYEKKTQKEILYNFYDPGGFAEPYQIFPLTPMTVFEDYVCSMISTFVVSQIQQLMVKNRVKVDVSHPHFNEYSIIMNTQLNDNPIIALYKFNSIR